MKLIFLFIFSIFISLHAKDNDYINKMNEEKLSNTARTSFIIANNYNLKFLNSYSVDDNGNIIRNGLLQDTRKISLPKEILDKGEYIYLQSLTYGDRKNWSIVVNNIVINNKSINKIVNELAEIVKVEDKRVHFKFFNINEIFLSICQNKKKQPNDRFISIRKGHDGKEEIYFSLGLNQYLNINNCKIYSGNMALSSYYLSRG